MDPLQQRYEQHPYPTRDPEDERHRLIEGSPSHPIEIDHHLFGGRRDWQAPFCVLVAGGGTGDGLIMLAQEMADIGCPAEITYLDLSSSARAIAEARAEIRGLDQIRFVTADLTTAPELGRFDYIDCCGVLHHLDDPDAGFAALAEALTPEGGIGLMVYAPHGRSGVYPLQQAFTRLLASTSTEQQPDRIRQVLGQLGENHPFVRNRVIGDHERGDAELLDLLVAHRDRPYTVTELSAALERAGLGLAALVEPARYEPHRYLPSGEEWDRSLAEMTRIERAALAEQLAGTMKTHIAYATRAGREHRVIADGTDPDSVPHLRRVTPATLAALAHADAGLTISIDGHEHRIELPAEAAPLIAAIDGGRTVGQVMAASAIPEAEVDGLWAIVDRELTGFGLLNYSRFGRGASSQRGSVTGV